MDDSSVFGFALTLGIGIVLFSLLILAVTYVLSSIGIYKLAQRRGFENPWLAWIPFARDYVLGELADYNVFGIPNTGMVLAISHIAVFVLSLISGLTLYLLLSIIQGIYAIAVQYYIYRLYDPDRAVIYTIFFAFSFIWFFLIRNNAPIYNAEQRNPNQIGQQRNQIEQPQRPVNFYQNREFENLNNPPQNNETNDEETERLL